MTQETKLRDVFISYAQADSRLAERLAEEFSGKGLDAYYAPSNVRPGTSFLTSIDNGLRNTQVLVLLLSPDALKSFWVHQEWTAQLVQMSRDRTRRLIPVLLGNITNDQIPPLLGSFVHFDLRGVAVEEPAGFRNAVDGLIQRIKGDVQTTTGIPFVIAAMTQSEVLELMSGVRQKPSGPLPLFGNDEEGIERERQRVQLLEMLATDFKISSLEKFYGPSREDWNPLFRTIRTGFAADWTPTFQDEHEPIRAAIENAVARANQIDEANSKKNAVAPPDKLWAQFFSADFFSRDQQYRINTWEHLQKVGCMMIVDAVSLFHPDVLKMLSESGAGVSERISIVGMSPVPPEILPINRFLETQMQARLQLRFNRFNAELAPTSEFGISDARRLTRSLCALLPRVAAEVRGQIPSTTQQKRAQDTAREMNLASNNVHRAWLDPTSQTSSDRR